MSDELEIIKSRVNYDHETGIFRRKGKTQGGERAGCIAGTKCANGYIIITISRKRWLGHRLAWLYHYGTLPDSDIDHINGVRDDNRIENLRLATRSENLCNVGVRKTNTSGFKNVSWNADCRKWAVSMRHNGKKIYLGVFSDLHEAAKVASEGRKKLHGDFARDTIKKDK